MTLRIKDKSTEPITEVWLEQEGDYINLRAKRTDEDVEYTVLRISPHNGLERMGYLSKTLGLPIEDNNHSRIAMSADAIQQPMRSVYAGI